MAKEKDQTVNINDVAYKMSDLSDNAKHQLVNLRITDQEITRLNHKLAIAQTARAAYAKALADELPKTEASTAVQ